MRCAHAAWCGRLILGRPGACPVSHLGRLVDPALVEERLRQDDWRHSSASGSRARPRAGRRSVAEVALGGLLVSREELDRRAVAEVPDREHPCPFLEDRRDRAPPALAPRRTGLEATPGRRASSSVCPARRRGHRPLPRGPAGIGAHRPPRVPARRRPPSRGTRTAPPSSACRRAGGTRRWPARPPAGRHEATHVGEYDERAHVMRRAVTFASSFPRGDVRRSPPSALVDSEVCIAPEPA